MLGHEGLWTLSSTTLPLQTPVGTQLSRLLAGL